MLASGGCYRHVVEAEGVGSDEFDTYEANDPQEDESDLKLYQGEPSKDD